MINGRLSKLLCKKEFQSILLSSQKKKKKETLIFGPVYFLEYEYFCYQILVMYMAI